jgi:hypothetical protein
MMSSVLLLAACGGGGGGSDGGGAPASGLVYLEGASFTLPVVQEDSGNHVTNVDELMQALAVSGGHPVKTDTGANPYDYQDGTLVISQNGTNDWTVELRDESNNVLAAISGAPQLYANSDGSLDVGLGTHTSGAEVDFVVSAQGHITNGEIYAPSTGNRTIEFANGLVDAWGDPVRDALVSLMGSWTGTVAYDSIDGEAANICHGATVTLTINSDANMTLSVGGASACATFDRTLNWSQLVGNNNLVEDRSDYDIGLDTDSPSGTLDINVDDYQNPSSITGMFVTSGDDASESYLETGSLTRN